MQEERESKKVKAKDKDKGKVEGDTSVAVKDGVERSIYVGSEEGRVGVEVVEVNDTIFHLRAAARQREVP
jgi:hypothetical protein